MSRWAALVAAAVVGAGALTGCGAEEATRDTVDRAVDDAGDRVREEAAQALEGLDVPTPDWEQYGDLRQRVERFVAENDCASLREELSRAEGEDAVVERYLKGVVEAVDCG